jgi:hypothetical protein
VTQPLATLEGFIYFRSGLSSAIPEFENEKRKFEGDVNWRLDVPGGIRGGNMQPLLQDLGREHKRRITDGLGKGGIVRKPDRPKAIVRKGERYRDSDICHFCLDRGSPSGL